MGHQSKRTYGLSKARILGPKPDPNPNTDRRSLPGITSCITPGGLTFFPYLGRNLLGYEKLLLNGIPADRLQLGQETEVQLSDLAGNAMSLPVVSATMLAALCVEELARRRAQEPL